HRWRELDFDIVAVLQHAELVVGDVPGDVDFVVKQRGDATGQLWDVDDAHPLERRRAVPVVRVRLQFQRLAGREAGHAEGPASRQLDSRAVFAARSLDGLGGRDLEEGKIAQEGTHRLRQLDFDGRGIDGLHV